MGNIEYLSEKEHIIEVSTYLHEIGLMARTWGNVSCRVDEDHFLITPTGIRYENLTPDMIDLVNIHDLSYVGEYEPSSETRIHAAVYSARKKAGFIIHTHQVFASCAGVLGQKKIFTYFDDEDLTIPVVVYAKPGSKKLSENVTHTLKKYKHSNGIILSNHGAICIGETSNEALYETEVLESASNNFLADVCKVDVTQGVEEKYSSHLEEGEIVFDEKDTPERVKNIHKQIYSKRKDISYVVHNKSEAVLTVSKRANHIRPLFDDFAQLIGTGVKVPANEDEISHVIKRRVDVVFSPNDGAYCLGESEDEARAVAQVLDKACIAYIAVMRNGEGHYISNRDCIRLNRDYRKRYRKLADRKISDDQKT